MGTVKDSETTLNPALATIKKALYDPVECLK
jgi:hypothetical protein